MYKHSNNNIYWADCLSVHVPKSRRPARLVRKESLDNKKRKLPWRLPSWRMGRGWMWWKQYHSIAFIQQDPPKNTLCNKRKKNTTPHPTFDSQLMVVVGGGITQQSTFLLSFLTVFLKWWNIGAQTCACVRFLRRGRGSYIGNNGRQTNDNQKLTKGDFWQGGLNFAPLPHTPKTLNCQLKLLQLIVN